MTIDKSWITNRRRNSDEFWNGLQAFIQMAKNHVNASGEVRYPCVQCVNILNQNLVVVEAHIHIYGFLQRYVKWTYHGEVDMPSVVDDGAPVTDEMIDIINDVIGE